MKILNFIPLLVWMLVYIPFIAISNKIDPPRDPAKADTGAGIIYLAGCLLWIVIGGCV